MNLKSWACLLILLASTSGLEDVLAAMSNPRDDSQTAENDEFIPAAPQRKRPQLREGPTEADRLEQRSVPSTPAPAPGVRPGPLSGAPVKPPLLYVLMSLQR
jgi:hypothetical protein